MSKSQQPNKGQMDGGEAIAILLLMAVVLLFVIWGFAHKQISMVYVHYRYLIYYPFYLFQEVSGLNLPLFSNIHAWVVDNCKPDGLLSLCHADFESYEWRSIKKSTMYFNGAVLSFLLYRAVKQFLHVDKKHPLMNHRKVHNLDSFIDENKQIYPHLKLFGDLDLINRPIDSLDDPVFGMSLTCRQFASTNNLIKGWEELEDGSYLPILDEKETLQKLHDQLGEPFSGIESMSEPQMLVMSAVISKVAATDPDMNAEQFKQAVKDSDDIIAFLWSYFEEAEQAINAKDTEFDLTFPKKIINAYLRHPLVRRVIEKHAYSSTIIYRMFLEARRLGVLQPSEFRWLKYFDRQTWYVVNNIGRQACFAEAAGVHCHYLYECASNEAILDPQLDKAFIALQNALADYKYLEKTL